MIEHIVIVPVEMDDSDLEIILQLSRKLRLSRNETIRVLIRRGFETFISGEQISNNEEIHKSESPKDKKPKRGDKE